MELKGFRELLLKKAQGNTTLQTLIAFSKEEILADAVLEILEKMAKPSTAMGRSANSAVTAFAGKLKNSDVRMMRDHLAHHLSHYKSALKASQHPDAGPKAANYRDVADKHLEKVFTAMHLIGKASPHSNGLLGMDYTVPRAWEENYTRPDRLRESDNKTPKEETQGLNRRPRKGVSRNPYHPEHPEYSSHKGNPSGIPDYRYLEMAPHPLTATDNHILPNDKGEHIPHEGGYPFERLNVGNPLDVDKKEAHIHLFEPESTEDFTPHPFDEHPIHKLKDVPQGQLKDDPRLQEFADELSNWHGSEHYNKWMQKHKEDIQKDPEGHKNKPKVRPSHFYEGIKLQEEPYTKHHRDKKMATAAKEPAQAQPQQEAPAKTSESSFDFTPEQIAKFPPSMQALIASKKKGGQGV